MLAFAPIGCAAAQDVPAPVLTWAPERPVPGTLFRVRIDLAGGATRGLEARVAGERLHFATRDSLVWDAIAAAPIDADTVAGSIVIHRTSRRSDTIRIALPTSPGEYRLERLTVAPQFGSPPDSATQARIRREQQRALDVSRRSHDTPRLWTAEIVQPRETRVTSGFGHGREFNGQVQSRHMGTDFAGGVGSPVRAAARGVVALVDTFHLAGNVIYIDHGAGLVTAYFHLSRQDVAPGDTVTPGQVIGRVGATGRVTGPHLHWVVRYGTITVDPLSLLALADSAAPRPQPAQTLPRGE